MINKINAALVAVLISTVAYVAVAAEQVAQTPAPYDVEKCFGVAKANTKGDGNENNAIFVNLPKGKCEMLENGSLKPIAQSTTTTTKSN
ncbi:MAG: hypothetical protein JSS50_05570 [Proteobacteria bacterium]|nr:hypothetical protein [Pseudomonadota bacterium]